MSTLNTLIPQVTDAGDALRQIGDAVVQRLETLEVEVIRLQRELADAREARDQALQEAEELRNFGTFPTPGVWLVQARDDGRESRVIWREKQGELPDPMPLAAIASRTRAIAEAVVKCREIMWSGKGLSAHDVAEAIVDELYRAEQQP